jgi:hypothetical protein
MNFKEWIIEESSLSELYHSAVAAFPRTQKRQHATDPIKIIELKWTPFLGMKTLMVRGIAQSEHKMYSPIILFKNVKDFTEAEINKNYISPDLVTLSSDENTYYFNPLSSNTTEVLVRCNCNDFYWRGNFANYLDKSLQGRKRKKYESKGINPPANPDNAPMMCKHLMKMTMAINAARIFVD